MMGRREFETIAKINARTMKDFEGADLAARIEARQAESNP